MAYCVTGTTPAIKYHWKRGKLRRGLHYLLWWWNVMKWDNRFLKIILRAKTAKRKEKEVFIRYECKTAEGRRNFTTPCTTAGTSWRFSCFSLVFQTCILSRFVSFVFFCCVFFLLPLYAPSMNTNSSYVSFILSYTELHLCFSFWFLVFLKSPR